MTCSKHRWTIIEDYHENGKHIIRYQCIECRHTYIEVDGKIIKKDKKTEHRFRDFLIAKVKPGGPSDLIIFKKNGTRKVVKCDENPLLDVFGLNNAQKLEFLFEQDYPKRKAIEHGDTTSLFRAWLNRKNFNDDYFKHGDVK